MDAKALDTLDLNDCIESALNIGRNLIKDKVEVTKELGTLPPVTGTPSQLNQVFLNLISNAAHAMEGRGQLHIKSWAANNAVHVSVADNGKGIPPENLSLIFDPIFTTKPVGEGTGLGLAISHHIILQHKGEIKVESRVGSGTCFNISLPCASRKMPQAAIH
jgi:signal transduction histidine kinase